MSLFFPRSNLIFPRSFLDIYLFYVFLGSLLRVHFILILRRFPVYYVIYHEKNVFDLIQNVQVFTHFLYRMCIHHLVSMYIMLFR